MMSMATYFILQVRTEARVNQGKNGEDFKQMKSNVKARKNILAVD